MIGRRARRVALVAALGVVALAVAAPSSASAFNPIKPLCSAGSLFSGAIGKACSVAGALLGGGGGGGVSAVASKASTALALAAVGVWVTGGAKFALRETAHVLGRTTTPQLDSVWFSSTYWRVAGISALLTLPFLFAAAVQAIIGSDLALLIRSAFGYLPLAALAVGIAAPLTMLLLSASDEMSAIVASAAGDSSAHFLGRAAGAIGGLSLGARSPFLVFFAGLLTVGAAVALWLELLVRGSAVYVIVLMLPLVFAAMIWPARRVWALRAVELLLALILSKFAIVAVLSLGGAAISQTATSSVTGLIAGVTLLGLAICAPWALLRLLPMAELASSVAGSLRGETRMALDHVRGAEGTAVELESLEAEWASSATAHMRRDSQAGGGDGIIPAPPLGEAASEPPPSEPPPSEPPPSEPPPSELPPESPPTEPPLAPPTPPAPPAPPTPPAPPAPPTAPASPRPWEAPDRSLPTLVLGPDADWRPAPLDDQP